jgi:hypothetical protein
MRLMVLWFFVQNESEGLQAERRQSADGMKIVFRQPVRNRERVFVYKEYILIVHNELSSHSKALKVHGRKVKFSKIDQERQAWIDPMLLILIPMVHPTVKGRSFPRRV